MRIHIQFYGAELLRFSSTLERGKMSDRILSCSAKLTEALQEEDDTG